MAASNNVPALSPAPLAKSRSIIPNDDDVIAIPPPKKKPFMIKFNVYFQFPSKTKCFKDVWEVSSSDLAEGGRDLLDCLDEFCGNQNPSMKLKSFRLGWRVSTKDVPTVCNGDFYNDSDVPTWDTDFTLVLTAIENPSATKKESQNACLSGELSEASSANEYEKPPPKKIRRTSKNVDSKKNKKTRTEKKQEEMENIEKELRRELPAFVQSKMSEDEFTKYSFLRHNKFIWTIGKITEEIMNEKNNNNDSCNNEPTIPYMAPPVSPYMPPPVPSSYFQQPHIPQVPSSHFQQPQVGTAPIIPDMQSTMSNMVQLQMMKMMEKLTEH